mgnify:CR=1 FL=1
MLAYASAMNGVFRNSVVAKTLVGVHFAANMGLQDVLPKLPHKYNSYPFESTPEVKHTSNHMDGPSKRRDMDTEHDFMLQLVRIFGNDISSVEKIKAQIVLFGAMDHKKRFEYIIAHDGNIMEHVAHLMPQEMLVDYITQQNDAHEQTVVDTLQTTPWVYNLLTDLLMDDSKLHKELKTTPPWVAVMTGFANVCRAFMSQDDDSHAKLLEDMLTGQQYQQYRDAFTAYTARQIVLRHGTDAREFVHKHSFLSGVLVSVPLYLELTSTLRQAQHTQHVVFPDANPFLSGYTRTDETRGDGIDTATHSHILRECAEFIASRSARECLYYTLSLFFLLCVEQYVAWVSDPKWTQHSTEVSVSLFLTRLARIASLLQTYRSENVEFTQVLNDIKNKHATNTPKPEQPHRP